jgi:hypothetical protein
VTARLDQALSSETSQSGRQFQATLAEPIAVDGQPLAERGAAAVGHVVSAQPSGRLKHPGFLSIALDSVTMGGKMVSLQSSHISVQGSGHKKRNLAWIGGSSAGGALIGGLIGGGKGALIGSLAGAGAGTTTAYATGKHNVGFAVEQKVTFRLTQAAPLQ